MNDPTKISCNLIFWFSSVVCRVDFFSHFTRLFLLITHAKMCLTLRYKRFALISRLFPFAGHDDDVMLLFFETFKKFQRWFFSLSHFSSVVVWKIYKRTHLSWIEWNWNQQRMFLSFIYRFFEKPEMKLRCGNKKKKSNWKMMMIFLSTLCSASSSSCWTQSKLYRLLIFLYSQSSRCYEFSHFLWNSSLSSFHFIFIFYFLRRNEIGRWKMWLR